MAQMSYEDFRVGQIIRTDSRKITQEMIHAFAELTGDKNPIHLDEEAAQNSIFHGIVSHGRLTGDIAIGLLWPFGMLDGIALGEDQSDYKRPVRPGDKIRCEFLVSSKKRDKGGKGFGKIYIRGTVLNQNDKPVLLIRARLLAKHKPAH